MTNAPDWVSFYARRNGIAPALESVDNGKTMSWGQLEQRVSALSGVLVSRFGVKRGDRVSVIAENDFRVFELLFACMRIGAIFVPMNWRLTPTELSVLIEDCEPGVLLHDEIWAETAQQLVRLADGEITLFGWGASGGEYERAMAAAEPLAGNWTADIDDPTCILYTSGTTGIPKGSLVSHRTLLAQVENAFVDCLLGLPGSKYLNPMPLFHAGGLTTLCLPVLASGGAVAFARRFDPAQCLDWLVDPAREVTHFNGSPIFFEQLAGCSGFGRSGFSHLKHAHVAGATIMDSLIDQWADAGFLVQQFYGGTEMGPSAMAMPLSRVLDKRGSCGLPMLLTRSRLVDADMVDVPIGSEGEILLAGPAITPGYWRREPTSADWSDGWFRTGDVARQDEDGFHYIVDRVKDVYKSGGESVFPAEIERALLEMPSVSEVAVIGVPHDRWGEVGCAVIVAKQGDRLTVEDLQIHLQGRFARYKFPKEIMLVDDLPRNALGKTDKKLLRGRYAALRSEGARKVDQATV
ncbi:AMP-binding protein [Hoeflea sp. WL0058]|uniref:3-methylmercaptopropionyl-CoA ligase n=1 Tax=Flavimaribacter sediminis TaxID=2865987 RepID=A0AAE2ZN33_9HYPH|nr:AMP-binding protein [Flavimaribacter sediminis]MBW8637333.1 AMP-binding protein [Flavimaribacter sediminis]